MPEAPVTPLSLRTRTAYAALAAWLADQQRSRGLKVLGINGAQGSGKTALAGFLVAELQARHGLRALTISLDDFYFGRAARAVLAETIHPLFVTRGVPGTHDVQRGIECLSQLRTLASGQRCSLPTFSKAKDDALGAEHDRVIDEAPDLILFEGWCVATPPQAESALDTPVNDLERLPDPAAAWRRHVNEQLAGPYARWFAAIDALVHLAVPGWEQVRAWRTQQEHETAAQNAGVSSLRSAADIDRFLQHYQRLTAHALAVLPQKADVVLQIDAAHDIADARYR